jgi:hypothetical protein
MIDVSKSHPIVATAAFAVEWLGHLANYDLTKARAMIDVDESGIPFSESLPEPVGFTYARPNQVDGWSLHYCAMDDSGLCVDFEVPFLEKDFRCMMAKFTMNRKAEWLKVVFGGLDVS